MREGRRGGREGGRECVVNIMLSTEGFYGCSAGAYVRANKQQSISISLLGNAENKQQLNFSFLPPTQSPPGGVEVQYSEVRKGPRYVPKSRSESRSPPPHGVVSPAPKVPRSPGGVSELDSLLEMLNETQINIKGQPAHELFITCLTPM